MNQLADQDIRDRVIHETECSFALSAGAGSGKTSVLVERLVQHLLRGIPPERIAAITFTEKAASEMAERTRDALEEHFARGTPAQRALIEQSIRRFGTLTISTIHSFCQELLRLEAFEAGWIPHTDLAEEFDNHAFAAVYQQWRQGFEQRHPEWAVMLNRSAQEQSLYPWQPSLRTAALQLLNHRYLLTQSDALPRCVPLQDIDWNALFHALQRQYERLHQLALQCQDPQGSKQYQYQKELLHQLQRLAGTRTWRAREAVLLSLELQVGRILKVQKKSAWGDPAIEQAFVHELRQLANWLTEQRNFIYGQLHSVLIRDLRDFLLPQVQRAKRSAGQASYADLLIESAQLLHHNAAARRRLHQRFSVILIDEVQDTDPIQAEVATLLTRSPELQGPWDSAPPKPGSLFAVGDPKQSIYRFRGADVDTWKRLQTLISQDGEALSLRQNFRSVPGLVHWFNFTFANYPGYEPQISSRSPAKLDPVVIVHTPDKEGESDALLQHLLDLQRQGAEVIDRKTGQPRPMRWGDVMILLPTWNKADELQEKLSLAGIDYVLEGGKGFFKREEIRLCLAAMKAIEEPLDAESLILVLRGFFGLSHAELATFKANGGRWRYTYSRNPGGPVSDAFQVLRRLHSERSQRSWVDLLDDLLQETHASAIWSLMKRGRGSLANLDKLKVMLRDLELQTRSPGEVVKALEQQQRAANGASELSLLDEDLDAVCVTSIFQAKGLEAPIVALVHERRMLQVSTHVVDRLQKDLALRISDKLSPPGWEDLQNAEKQEYLQEFRRLMYVAATRARDQLIIVRSPAHDQRRGSTVSLYQPDIQRSLQGIKQAPHDSWQQLAPDVRVRIRQATALPPVPYTMETFPGFDQMIDPLLETRPERGDPESEARENALKEALKASRKRSIRWRSVGYLSARHTIESEGGGIGPAGGTVVHQVMQYLDLGRPQEELLAEAPKVVETFARLSRLSPELTERCLQVVERLLRHPVIDEARAASERWREIPFAYRERGTVISGQIDLCFPLNPARTQWKVVDWKSTLPPPDSELHEVYRRQLAYYSKALLATVTPCQHVDATLVGPHQEIGIDGSWEEALQQTHDDALTLFLQTLQAHNYKDAPIVGMELGESEDDYVMLELAWEKQKKALGLDLTEQERHTLQAQGWQVAEINTNRVGWQERAVQALISLLDLPPDWFEDPKHIDTFSQELPSIASLERRTT